MAFQRGTQVRPELGALDFSGYARAAQVNAQMLAELGQNVATTIDRYKQKKEEKQELENAVTIISRMAEDNPQAAAELGMVDAAGDVDSKAIQAFVKEQGVGNAMQTVYGIKEATENLGRMGAAADAFRQVYGAKDKDKALAQAILDAEAAGARPEDSMVQMSLLEQFGVVNNTNIRNAMAGIELDVARETAPERIEQSGLETDQMRESAKGANLANALRENELIVAEKTQDDRIRQAGQQTKMNEAQIRRTELETDSLRREEQELARTAAMRLEAFRLGNDLKREQLKSLSIENLGRTRQLNDEEMGRTQRRVLNDLISTFTTDGVTDWDTVTGSYLTAGGDIEILNQVAPDQMTFKDVGPFTVLFANGQFVNAMSNQPNGLREPAEVTKLRKMEERFNNVIALYREGKRKEAYTKFLPLARTDEFSGMPKSITEFDEWIQPILNSINGSPVDGMAPNASSKIKDDPLGLFGGQATESQEQDEKKEKKSDNAWDWATDRIFWGVFAD